MEPLVLAIDLGSSSTRSAVFDSRGHRLEESAATAHYTFCYTKDGGAELDPAALLRATRLCVQKTRRVVRRPSAAIAGSAFWHGLLGLDRQGRPLTPVYTWADTRAVDAAAQLRTELKEREIQARTGCMLRAPFWPAKLRWLRNADRAHWRRVRSWVSPGSWIFRELFGTDATSHSMASGTGLYNLRQRTWDTELCELCGVTAAQLGAIDDLPSGQAQVFSPIGDGAASNLGSGADRAGLVAINIGTSAAARMVQDGPTRKRLPFGLFRYVVDEQRTVFGGAVSNAGNLRNWCTRELNLGDGSDAERALGREAAASDRLTVLPFLVSERAPTWPENIRGTIAGLTAATSAADFFRAATTATYYRLADIFDSIESTTAPVEQVIVSGGVLHSPRALTLLADCLGRDLHLSRELESSLRGAAVHGLALLGCEPRQARAARVVRHRPALSIRHQERRRAQSHFERLMWTR